MVLLPREPSPRSASNGLLKLAITGRLLDEAAAAVMKSNPSCLGRDLHPKVERSEVLVAK